MDSALDTKAAQKVEIDSPSDDYAGKYKPKNKQERQVRRFVYKRYAEMRDSPARTEAEAEWELADKEYRLHFDSQSGDDWRANLHLPDSFAAIQVFMQETNDRKSRPSLRGVEDSDEPFEDAGNATLSYNMDTTGYDAEVFNAKLGGAIRGHGFLREYWRLEKRKVQMPSSVDDDGNLQYEEKEIIDHDDSYTEWIPNEYVQVDEKALSDNDMIDYVRREILNVNEFHRVYDNKAGFINQEYVYQGGETTTRSFFQMPKDITEQDVEVLHYQNKKLDAYWVVANNVPVYIGPLPSPHKQLDISSVKYTEVPGRYWGMGIPQIIHYLSEERKTIRNMNLDRQKLHLQKVFLHNSSYDIDDEDTELYPNKIISVDTQGQPIGNAMVPLEYGDVPASYFRTEQIMREDIIRGTGIDDRQQGINIGSTATEAAILKESALKRINMIMTRIEQTAIRRIGHLKWENIRFFYPIPRIEHITEDNEERAEKTYKTIAVQGKKFEIVNDDGKRQLKMSDVKGSSAFQIKGKMADFLEKSYDIIVDVEANTPPSKALQQSKVTEMFAAVGANPMFASVLDPTKAVNRLLTVNDESPKNWMRGEGLSPNDLMMLAESENMVLAAGQPLSGTEGATEEHTLVHLMYTKTQDFSNLSPETQQLFQDHIMQEHDNNPSTGAAGDLLGAEGNPPLPPNINPTALAADTGQPQVQAADIQPTTQF